MEWAHGINYKLNTLINFNIGFKTDPYGEVLWCLGVCLIFFFFFWITWLYCCSYLSWEFRFTIIFQLVPILLRSHLLQRLPLSGSLSDYILVDVCTSRDVLNCQFVQSWITLMMDCSWNAFLPTITKLFINDFFLHVLICKICHQSNPFHQLVRCNSSDHIVIWIIGS